MTQPTDMSEKGLETIIVNSLISDAGYVQGDPKDYDREFAIDLPKLIEFVQNTQPEAFEALQLGIDTPKRRKFLDRLCGEIAKHGIIDVLRRGVKDGPVELVLYYSTPSEKNIKAGELFDKNIFSVTRQLRYSQNNANLALDMVIFINGLPIITFELKNKITRQTVEDAVWQYKRDRDAADLLFQFGRCAVHFAVDDHEVRMCAHLKNKASWFLPFNKGYNDGAGNPPNPAGIATDYLWKEILRKESLANIIENYAQIVEKKDDKTGKKKREQIFPRYHQLDVVRKILASAKSDAVGTRYLIQHSAGSGKSNSISWLAHQLVDLEKNGTAVFDTIIVVTDRRVLDKQLRDNIKRFAQVSNLVGAVTEGSGQLRKFIQEGKKIIITTVQKFPFILDEIGDSHRGNKFAIIIDEAHSSQGGRTASKMNMALSNFDGCVTGSPLDMDIEDRINEIIERRKMLTNASYFAFTATPKNKTLEIFGAAYVEGDRTKHRPFHSYTMKQAIQEGFILDVLQNYTPVNSYYKLIKSVEGDPEFDIKRAKKKLRRYVESHEHAIRQKAEIMIDHFNEEVAGKYKIGGNARAMVVCSGVERAIDYYKAFCEYLAEIKLSYKAIVAFAGEFEYGGMKVTESSLNGFAGNDIPDVFQTDPYRFLIVADKYQTGYDEPLLHTMYVDKQLSGIKAVQTLSRLNRAHPQKTDTFVLDFMNESDIIQEAFSDYYRTTILSDETDPNKLHDLKSALDGYRIYSESQVNEVAGMFIFGVSRDNIDPLLDACVRDYVEQLDEDGQVEFKGKAKAFIRTYNFLASILPYSNSSWEKLSIFLNFLIPKLPAPPDEDGAKGILETIDMDSYRAEIQESRKIKLNDGDAEIGPVPVDSIGKKPEPEYDRLSNIIKTFNELFGNIKWNDIDKIQKIIAEELPGKVAADKAYQNAMNQDDKQNARIEHDNALKRVITEMVNEQIDMLNDQTELYKQFFENAGFQKWLTDTIFNATYKKT
ncbi:MAG: Type I restriction enzyme EcoR124II R protein [bacterium ADurb.Bin243]|nr:MAG: Type I restriction enzyme EcoR124II R protein [bacterium ADurb.Bin243]HOD39066.1 type I restriction endonuclease subunit R [Candidatus Wallbacteria bacterium]